MWAENLIIDLKRREGRPAPPYHQQVFGQVRDAILSGTLRAGDRLPATRELARSLGIARNTVARAYEDLLAGGYLEGRVGSGTYVKAGLDLPRPAQPDLLPLGATPRVPSRSPARAVPAPPTIRIDLRPDLSDWEAFPRRLWLRLIGRALRVNSSELRRYGQPAGYFPLRDAIARHLAISRGVSAAAEQVVIVNGSQQALDLVARLCLRAGDRVAFEDPSYPEARGVLTLGGSQPLFIPVDDEGIDIEALKDTTRSRPAPRLVYVTPSHQYPTGAVLPVSRRLALLDWAARRNVLVVEDDYDSELRTPGRIAESLQGLDRARRVIYVGTFSTVLFPPLRVGYLVLPPEWTERFQEAKALADRQTPTLDQLALTSFLQEGHFERHLRAMRRLVAARRQALRDAIQSELGGLMEATGSALGTHVMVRGRPLPSAQRAADLERRIVGAAAAQGVAVSPAGRCWSRQPRHATFLLGCVALEEGLIREGVRELAHAAAAAAKKR